jgi:hypothetical protein
MMQASRRFLAAALLLFAVGCTAYDETAAQSEFERLRKYPVSPQADRILPDHGSGAAADEGHQYSKSPSAAFRTGKAQGR